MYCPKCAAPMIPKGDDLYRCEPCAQDLRDAPDPGPTFSQKMQGEIMKMAAAPLLNALGAFAQLPAALARIATALEDRASPSPLDALRAAHPDWAWRPMERGAMGTVYDGRGPRGEHIIARPDGDVWTAAEWHGIELGKDAKAPTPALAVGVLLGTVTVHTFRYVNHRDETRTVRILDGTQSLTMEPTIYHPYDGPKVRVWDVDRADWRVYDLARVVKP